MINRRLLGVSALLLGLCGCNTPSSIDPRDSRPFVALGDVVRSKALGLFSPTQPLLYVNSYASGGVAGFNLDSNGDATPQVAFGIPYFGGGGIAISATGWRYVIGSGCGPGGCQAAIGAFGPNAIGNDRPKRLVECGGLNYIGQSNNLAVGPDGRLAVVNETGAPNAQVELFSANSSGCVSGNPIISGSNTGLNSPKAVTFGRLGSIIVANLSPQSILVFNKNANGNVAPFRTIAGPHTHLVSPWGVAIDRSGSIYVADRDDVSVIIFRPDASGDAIPIRRIHGPSTGLQNPWSVCVGQDGRVYVATTSTSGTSVNVYPPSASGNVAPEQVIYGPETGLGLNPSIATNP